MGPPFIVAELSANHLGSLERALHIIDAAAEAGANAIKFQTWEQNTMVLDRAFRLESGPWAGRTLHDLYGEAYTPWHWHQTLYAYARSVRLVPFSSVFDTASIAFLETLQCPMYKISSFEIEDTALIDAAARTGKPLIISTGMAGEQEIALAAYHAYWAGCHDLTLLKCTSAYPAPADSMNLRAMESLRRWIRSGQPKAGISDHTTGIAVPVAATALGADVIEKHLTLSRADGGPDAAFSLEPHEFAAMVQSCRQAADALGTDRLGQATEENTSIPLRRSLYWLRGHDAGETVSEGSIATARPGEGLPPHRLVEVTGRRLNRPVSRGTPVQMEQFE